MDGRRPVAAAGGVGYRATQSPSFPAQVLSPQSQHRRIIHRGPPPPPPPGAASPNVSCYSQVAGHIVTKAASSSDTPTSSASSTPGGHQQNSGSCGEYGMGGRPGGHITQIRHQPSGVAAADRSTNDSVQSYHRMEHVTVRPRAQTRGGVPEHILENSAFQFNHMITGLDRSSLQNQTIREEDFTRGSIEMDPDLAAAVALSKLETRNGDKFYDEDPISIESLNRLTDRDNKAKIDQVCREFGWPQEQVAQAFRVRGTVDAAVEYILEKASTADSVDRASARSTANRHRVQ
ncbi:hypothetical protein FOL47_007448 [Perkinsus chesapeaki]|uniref:UBA domain-containing protein n=1 Tax=Perkinsus chesapeaki TaxID=330153 RepID=A0A7J6MW55_PERCH|nr:hypothetical protein FOL47_007448 [Perkinsus chesapeaki]